MGLPWVGLPWEALTGCDDGAARASLFGGGAHFPLASRTQPLIVVPSSLRNRTKGRRTGRDSDWIPSGERFTLSGEENVGATANGLSPKGLAVSLGLRA